jgi:hypothetical protein
MHTAGQPDRLLKVVKSERLSDGHLLVEVKDVNSGVTYLLLDPSFAGQLKSVQHPPSVVSVNPPVAVAPPQSNGIVQTPRGILGRVPAEPTLAAIPQARFASPLPFELPPTLVASVPAINPIPEVTPKLTPTLPAPPPARPLNRGVLLPELPTPPLQPVSMAPIERIRPYVSNSLNAVTPRLGTEPPEVRMAREIAPWVADLTHAIRPTVRMDAATALAEGRYGWRDEVKAYLARTAKSDPAAVVRAHCISLLSTLGYAELDYRNFLASCATDRSADVRVAATIALARLEPR